MKFHSGIWIASAMVVITASACGNEGNVNGGSGELPEVSKQAKAQFPTAMALQEKVVARSCSPSNGVCHNSKEYPDLHTAGNFVSVASKPCNQDKSDTPDEIFDGCEPLGEEIKVGNFRARIGLVGVDQYTDYDVYRDLTLDKPATASETSVAATFLRSGDVLVEVPSNITLTEGSNIARLSGMYNLDYQTYLALNTLIGGDPNGDGVFGYADKWDEITPGHPEKSYLIGRITGTVPGTRMPLANQALSDPEYVAIFCWIETLRANPQPEDSINYEGCRFAKNPVSYAVTP